MSTAVSVIIVNWNSSTLLQRCVESVSACVPNAEIVVIDNASTDGSLEMLTPYRNKVDIIRNSVNRGFAGAVNQGFAATSTSFVLILNPDVRPMPGSIQLLATFLETHAKAGAVGGYVNDKYLPRALPAPGTIVRQNLGLRVPAPRMQLDTVSKVEQPAASALVVRRDAYEDAGGFDERFFPAWYEDVDFSLRLKSAGWDMYFMRDAEFQHDGGYSAAVLGPKAFADAYYHNQLRFAQKHFGLAGRISVRASIAAGMIARIAARPANAAAYFNVIRGALGGWRR